MTVTFHCESKRFVVIFFSLDETIPYAEAEIEDLNQFDSVMEDDIQGIFKLPHVHTYQDTDISPTPSPTHTPANEDPNIIGNLLTEDIADDRDTDSAVEEGNFETISEANVERTPKRKIWGRPAS